MWRTHSKAMRGSLNWRARPSAWSPATIPWCSHATRASIARPTASSTASMWPAATADRPAPSLRRGASVGGLAVELAQGVAADLTRHGHRHIVQKAHLAGIFVRRQARFDKVLDLGCELARGRKT